MFHNKRPGVSRLYVVVATVRPSGDQAGSASSAPAEKGVGRFVATSMMTRSAAPSASSWMKATRRPSGENARSEERRVGKEWRARWTPAQEEKETKQEEVRETM